MALDDITRFISKSLASMKNPRVVRALIQSFHSRLIQGDIYNLDKQSIDSAAEIETKYGFISHAQKLLSHFHYKTAFTMPGAENFTAYLNEKIDSTLIVKGPEVVDVSYHIDHTKIWRVFSGKQQLGEYCTFGPKPGENDFGRQYSGRLPGYTNEVIVVVNQDRPIEEQKPVDLVSLSWDNKKFEAQDMHKGPGKIIDTPWQRQDGHNGIPFP